MQILVKFYSQATTQNFVKHYTQRGQDKDNFTLEVDPSDTVDTLQQKIADNLGTPAYQLRLVFDQRSLCEYRTLSHYKIQQDSTIHALLRLRGKQDMSLIMQSRSLNDREARKKVLSGERRNKQDLESIMEDVDVHHNVGDWIEYLEGSVWYKGVISRDNMDQTYDIAYVDHVPTLDNDGNISIVETQSDTIAYDIDLSRIRKFVVTEQQTSVDSDSTEEIEQKLKLNWSEMSKADKNKHARKKRKIGREMTPLFEMENDDT